MIIAKRLLPKASVELNWSNSILNLFSNTLGKNEKFWEDPFDKNLRKLCVIKNLCLISNIILGKSIKTAPAAK